jgi:hypothetical protein
MQFIVYHVTIEQALTDYRQRYGSEPRAIIAHPKAQITVPVDVASVAVERNGGCLVGELWLPVPETRHAG